MKKLVWVIFLFLAFMTSAQAGVALAPLNPVNADTASLSVSSSQIAAINFVNNLSISVDLYWIDFSGDRVFYATIPAAGSLLQLTFITHPWLIVASGSSGTTTQGTGQLIAAYTAVTPGANDLASADVANITYYTVPDTRPVPTLNSLALLAIIIMLGFAGALVLPRIENA